MRLGLAGWSLNRRFTGGSLKLLDYPKHVKKELKAYTEMEDRLKAELCDMIGANEYATVNGTVIATWKGRTWASLDVKAIKAMEPAITEKVS
jgi:hypothetical protein